jgi:hypothetical protein
LSFANLSSIWYAHWHTNYFAGAEIIMADINIQNGSRIEVWPSLPLEEWKDAYATLHMWTQIFGKIRLM